MAGYMPYQNPYIPQQAFNQPVMPTLPAQAIPQQTMPTSGIVGRYVASESEITAQDVAMGAAPSLFPLNDGTAIIAKQWSNDGTIHTVRYSAELEQPNETSSISLIDIVNQLDNIQDTLDAMQQVSKPAPKRTTKKEVDDAEAK